MASFFGEVTGLTSRAVYDDDDFLSMQTSKWLYNVDSNFTPKSCEFVVFGVGKLAIAFVQSNFGSSEAKLIASATEENLVETENNISGLNYSKKPKPVLRAYSLPSNDKVLICEVDDCIPEDMNVDLCNWFRDTFLCKDVEAVVLTACHSSVHKSENRDMPASFLRHLQTARFSEEYSSISGIEYLESPNIICDFPAAIITEFQIRNDPAVMVIAYSDVMTLDTKSVNIFEDALKIPLLCKKLKKNEDAEKRLLDLIKHNAVHVSNLYI